VRSAELFPKNNKTRLDCCWRWRIAIWTHVVEKFSNKKRRTRTGLSSSTPVWMRLESDSTGKRCWELHGPSAGQVSLLLSQHGAYTHSSQYLKKKEKREGMSREREREICIYTAFDSFDLGGERSRDPWKMGKLKFHSRGLRWIVLGGFFIIEHLKKIHRASSRHTKAKSQWWIINWEMWT
jgi:hypothetical protein